MVHIFKVVFYGAKNSWKMAVKTLILFEKAVFLLLRLSGHLSKLNWVEK